MNRMRQWFYDFLAFIKAQGIGGFAIGFVLGGAVQKLVVSFVDDILNPVLGIVFGGVSSVKDAYVQVGSIRILWGDFVNSLIGFLVLAAVVYASIKLLKLEPDKK